LGICNKHVGISQSFSQWNNLTEEERETIRRLKHDGCKLRGERSGMMNHIASKVEVDCLNEAAKLEDLQLPDDLFDIATALCLGVHNGRVDKMLDVLRTIKHGHNNHNLSSLLKTTAASYDLDILQKAKSVNELEGLKDNDKAILLKHGDKKSLLSLLSIKRGYDDHKAERSKWAQTLNRNKNTERQEELEKSGCKELFCGFCGATKFFKESSRVRGTCLEKCYSRDYGFSQNKHTKWKVTKPTQEEMDALNKKYRDTK
jgi:hypothetical protein